MAFLSSSEVMGWCNIIACSLDKFGSLLSRKEWMLEMVDTLSNLDCCNEQFFFVIFQLISEEVTNFFIVFKIIKSHYLHLVS